MAELSTRSFILRRIHSLSGVVPVGLFLMFHLFINAHATNGAKLYNERAEFLTSLPWVWALEMVFIFIPLLYHALYGLIITVTGQPNTVSYAYGRNWNYLLQRISGGILLAFVIYHLIETKIWALQQKAAGMAHPDLFARMGEILSSPWAMAFYIIGTAAAVYHFANGMWNFCITWGITISRGAQQRGTIVWALLGLALFALGISSLLSFNGNWGITGP